MTKINFVKENVRKPARKTNARGQRLAPITVLHAITVALFFLVLGLLLNTQRAEAKSIKREGRVVKTSTLKSSGNKNLYCTSNSAAPVYLGQSGRWTLTGEVVSDFTLKELSLKTNARHDLGSVSERISRDARVKEERLFALKPDPFCNYELSLPRDFSGEKKFNARLVETCDNMFDGTAELNCSIRD